MRSRRATVMVDDDAPKRAVEDYRLELERRLPRCSPSRALPRFRSLSKTTVAWFLNPQCVNHGRSEKHT